MASVFAGFIFTADPGHQIDRARPDHRMLIDAFIVRLTLVHAVMTLLGQRAWQLPGWLDRILPNVDIEGATLPAPAAHVTPASGPGLPAGDQTQADAALAKPRVT
jgi:RND superfamily putative drug exporter